MSEREAHKEQEPQPRQVTGIFRLNRLGVRFEFSPEGKVLPAGDEPRFAVKDIELLFTQEGWAEFAERLAVHLEGVESELYRGTENYTAEESPLNELTDPLDVGEIRQISPIAYREAYLRKFGSATQGPMFL